jgi:hypothetical protein
MVEILSVPSRTEPRHKIFAEPHYRNGAIIFYFKLTMMSCVQNLVKKQG